MHVSFTSDLLTAEELKAWRPEQPQDVVSNEKAPEASGAFFDRIGSDQRALDSQGDAKHPYLFNS